jgi:hypothetical protein
MRKLRNIFSLWRTLRWADQEEWQETDRKALQAYLASQSGHRFTILLRNLTLKHQAGAVQTTGNLEWACGRASGFAAAAHLIDTLAGTQVADHSPASDDPADISDLLEHLHP